MSHVLSASIVLALLASSVAAQSDAPPVAVPDAWSTPLDDNLSVDAPGVLANDSDPDGDPLTAIKVEDSPLGGVFNLSSDGSFEYEPPTGFIGDEVFTYVANDGTSSSAPAVVTFTVDPPVGGGLVEFTDEPTFLAFVSSLGYATSYESFEDTGLWPQSPATADSVTNLGLTWTGNNASSGVTTGPGPAVFGSRGFFCLPHGSYTAGPQCQTPGVCTDGWITTAASTLMAFGGWVETNTGGPTKVEVILDDDPGRVADFGDIVLNPITAPRFFGVVDLNGFTSVEYHETEGKAEDQQFIYGDAFTFAFLQQPAEVHPYGCGVNPAGSLTVLAGAPRVGSSVTLGVDNPLGTQPPGSASFVGVAFAPDPAFPCGSPLPGFGMGGPGAVGEVLIPLAAPGFYTLLPGPPWAGPGSPAPIVVSIPASSGLVGVSVYTQGALLDPTPSAPVAIGLADAVELVIGA